MSDEALENLLHEDRRFPPTARVRRRRPTRSRRCTRRPPPTGSAFWERQAARLHWDQPWDQVLDWSQRRRSRSGSSAASSTSPYNCLDRHVEAGHGDQVAIHFEGEPGDTRTITYADLQREVCQAANALTELGVRPGDRVAIYLPMIPEAVVAMLACARIGAPHSVVFGGFSAEALRRRIDDAEAKLVITADGGYRRGSAVGAQAGRRRGRRRSAPTCEHVLVVRRTGQDVAWDDGRDVWWHDVVDRAADDARRPRRSTPSTRCSSSTPRARPAKPKGILHTTGGYLTQVAYTHRDVFDLKPDTDVYWCTADIGWVTGHCYIVYGPLANGATQVMYEGTPDTPHQGRCWEIVEKYRRHASSTPRRPRSARS